MSKLNRSTKGTNVNIVKVAAKTGQQLGYSANGNLQFKKEPLQHLYELTVSTLFGKGTFYKSSDALVRDLKNHVKTAVEMGAGNFVANLAIHARSEMNIRNMPVILVVEFAKAMSDKREVLLAEAKRIVAALNSPSTSGMSDAAKRADYARAQALVDEAAKYQYANMRQLVCDVIQRADQVTDLYAYALEVFGGKNKIPMAIRRGVADSMNKFTEYQLAKYNNGGTVKLRDVLRIVHPVAKNEAQGALFEKVMKNTLATPYTWEVELSANGQLPVAERKSKGEVWTDLITSEKLPYMASLRNLRNIHEAQVNPAIVKKVCDMLSDPHRVATSKQLPFDFVEAYKIVQPLDSKMATSVSKAIDLSVGNMPTLGEHIWVIIDYSGSMNGDAIDTATILAAALLKANEGAMNVAVTLFGSAAKTLTSIDTNDSILGIQKSLLTHRTGRIAGSTNFHAALQEKPKLGFEPDTIIVLSDGEVDGFPYSAVKNVAGRNVVKLAINLHAATTTPMSASDGWYAVAGWASAMFKFIPAIRNKETVVDQLSVPYIGLPSESQSGLTPAAE